MQRVLHGRRVAELVDGFERTPAYRGLAEALRVVITDGRVPVGVRLPSERELTDTLGVSRTTVSRAYAELRERGYLTSRQGSGWVAALPEAHGRGDHVLPPGELPAGKVDLTCAAPLPGPGVLAAYERAAAALPAHLAGTGYFPSGLTELREAVARSYDARGLPTDPGQVIIVPGALAGVAVAVRALLPHGARCLVESPTYPNAIATLQQAGARLAGLDAQDRWDHHAASVVRQVAPALAYLIPDFHNPTGALRDEAERAAMAAALRRQATATLVDESMVLLALDGRPVPPPMASYLPDAMTVGSLSKPFWGGLRVGWLRVPPRMVDAVVRSRLTLDLGTPVLEQLVACELLDGGADLVEHRRARLREARDAAVAALAAHLPEWRVPRPTGGLSLWCELPEPLSSALVPHAAAHDVLVAPGPSFAPEGGLDRFLRIPYTQPAGVLVDAVARLAQAWEDARAQPGTRSRRTASLVA